MYKAGDYIKNRYRIISELGKGSYGVVYHVYDDKLEADLALKSLIVDPHASSSLRHLTENLFKNEFEAGLKIKSPFVIRSHDYFADKSNPFFTMEYAQGGSFFSRMAEFVKDWGKFNQFAFHFYCGLSDTHRDGVIHRDIKAENILLDKNLHPKITDFGISYVAGDITDKFLGKRSKDVFGTDNYIAPEQRREDVSSRETGAITDIFSAGVMMYYVLTSGKNFPYGVFHRADDGYSDYIIRSQQNGWDDIKNYRKDIPDYWQEILHSSLEANPRNRIKSANDIRDILHKHLNDTHVKPLRPQEKFAWDELGLKIVVGYPMGKVYPLHEWMTTAQNGLITIGRYDPSVPKKNMINIADDTSTISRMQALIEYNRTEKKWYLRNGQFEVTSEGRIWREPPTGTMINEQDIDRYGAEIRVGDDIILGRKYLLKVVNIKK